MDGDRGLRLGISGAISPGGARRFLLDFGGLEGNRGISGALKAFWSFHAESETPSGFASLRDEKNWIVARLGNRRADWRVALGSFRLRGLRLRHLRKRFGKNRGSGQAERTDNKKPAEGGRAERHWRS